MKFSEIIYQRAENELKNRRERAERLASMRRKEFLASHPELLDIEREMKNAALEVIKNVGGNGQKIDIAIIAKRNIEAQEAKKDLIKGAGYPEDYLDIPYSCKKCEDTGIHNGKLCECHLALLQQLSVGELACSPLLARSTFDTFDVKYYSDIKDPDLGFSPYDYMRGCSKPMQKAFQFTATASFSAAARASVKLTLPLRCLTALHKGASAFTTTPPPQ